MKKKFRLREYIARFIIGIFFISHFFISVFPARAATLSSGIATYLSIQDTQVDDGSIVSFSPKGYLISKKPYDPFIFGVVALHPPVSLVTSGPEKTYPVISSGNTYVRVSSVNGNIAKGDLITTSTTPGVGVKATKSGYVVGAALESYASNNTRAVGKIAVALDVHYFTTKGSVAGSLTDIFNLSQIATYEEPATVVKYLIVALIILISFGAGFFIFEKTVTKGIDAIGRNPLASHIVQLGMAINILITIAITFGGLFIAYLVLRL